MASQGFFEYSSVTGVLSANLSLAIGFNPSVISFSCPPPKNGYLDKVGDATFRYTAVDEYSSDDFSRVFRDCLVDSVQVSRDGKVWDVALLDRRWKWSFGQVSGRYNNRVNGTVLPKNRRTLRQLVEICLDAMGETGYDTSVVDPDEYPSVEWDLEVPSRALATLVEEYGLTVSLQKDNTVKMVRLGFGTSLPTYNRLEFNQTFDPSNHPARIRSVSRPTVFQADLPLKAVGFEQEFDESEHTIKGNKLIDAGDSTQQFTNSEAYIYGPSSTRCTELKPIEELSYTPLAPSGYQPVTVNGKTQFYPVYNYPEGEEVRTWTRINPQSGQEGGGRSLHDFKIWGISEDNPQRYAIRQKKIQLFQQNIYKLYQVDISTLKSDSNIRLPIDFEITDIEQILPLMTHNIGREGCREDLRYKPALVYGSFSRGRDLSGNLETQLLRRDKDTGQIIRILRDNGSLKDNPLVPFEEIEPYMFQPFVDEAYNKIGGFSIEPEFGLVRFSQPMYAMEHVGDMLKEPNNHHKDIRTDRKPWERAVPINEGESFASFTRFIPAKIFLRCAIQVRNFDTGSYHRAYEEVILDDSLNTPPEFLPREDVHLQFMRPLDSYKPVLRDDAGEVIEGSLYTDEELAEKWLDNRGQVSKELKNYNNQAIYNYLRYPSAEANYAGFVDVDTDGAIKTITYSISNGVATSRAIRNSDKTDFALSVSEARIRQKTSDLIKKDKKKSRSVGDAARNVRANFMEGA